MRVRIQGSECPVSRSIWVSNVPLRKAPAQISALASVDLPGKCGEHQLRNQEEFYGKRDQTAAGVWP